MILKLLLLIIIGLIAAISCAYAENNLSIRNAMTVSMLAGAATALATGMIFISEVYK